MKYNTTSKVLFIRRAFREYLADGKPHRHGDIYEYIRDKAVGTPFEGKITVNNMMCFLKPLFNSPTSGYARVGWGLYQRTVIDESSPIPMTNSEEQICSIMDRTVNMLEELTCIYEKTCNQDSSAVEDISRIYKHAFDSLDEAVNALSAWVMKDLN